METTLGFRRGVSLVWGITWMTVLSGMSALAVDVGRAQLVKAELRRATDAAARAGAQSVVVGSTAAVLSAKTYAQLNKVDGLTLADGQLDIQAGYWNTSTKTFSATVPTGQSLNAVRVRGYRTATRGGGVATTFGQLLGMRAIDIQTESIALYVPGVDVNHDVGGQVTPFLVGMPVGSVASRNNPHNNPDVLGTNVPTIANVGMPIVPGSVVSFDSISGDVRHDPSLTAYNPDGNLDSIGHNYNPNNGDMNGTSYYNENGVADMRAPINALVGVFLSDAAPNASAAPSQNLDFSTAESRNFSTLRPQLKQIFFIGDGKMDDGITAQRFEVPAGATRLYLATWDFYEWNNNSGTRTIRVTRPGSVVMVK
jgi:Flp pilus assembly protein TadG